MAPLLSRRVPPTSRLAQIVAWLQGGDDGQPPLVVFDEVSPEQAVSPASSLSGPSLPQPNPCHVSRQPEPWTNLHTPKLLWAALSSHALQCHKAKNLLPSSGAQPTQTAQAVVELQVGGVGSCRRRSGAPQPRLLHSLPPNLRPPRLLHTPAMPMPAHPGPSFQRLPLLLPWRHPSGLPPCRSSCRTQRFCTAPLPALPSLATWPT